MFGKRFKIIVKTFFGLEETLRKEIENLGAKKIKVLNRAVEFEGNLELLYLANLKLRTALSVITPIFEFKAKSDQELYDNILEYNWGRIFNLHQTFAVFSVINTDFFNHSQYVSLKAKDAIADHFRKKYNERPDVDRKFADIKIVLHINQDQVTVLIDTSGKSLFQRGYKTEMTEAPINEVLAAGIILQSGWDKKTPFVDPMCGSGTFLIEAAMIASNTAPNLYRQRFGFQNLRNYDELLWNSIVDNSVKEINDDIPEIFGNDIDDNVIEIAQGNINNTRFAKKIKLNCAHFTNFEHEQTEGILITNPPYDERLKSADIIELYQDLGDTFKEKYLGFDCWVFSGNLPALKRLGLATSRRIKLFNGAIEGRLNLYKMYEGSKKTKYNKYFGKPEDKEDKID
jgi:putative N6-adenine-specific DNA methylase